MRKINTRLGHPDRAPASTKSSESAISEEPTVKEEVAVEEVVVEDASEKGSKKAKSKKWAEPSTDESEEAAQAPTE